MRVLRTIFVAVLQIFAILLLIFSIGTTFLFFQVNSSSASLGETLPSMLGYHYMPISESRFEQTLGVEKGALIIAVDGAEAKENTVAIFRTTEALSENAAYGMFAMGRVSAVVTDPTTNDTIVEIENLETKEPVSLYGSEIVATAAYQVPNGGSLMVLAQSANGIVFFVILPFFCFIAVQLLVLILHLISRPAKEQEEKDEEADNRQPIDYEAVRKEVKKVHPHTVFTKEEASVPVNTDNLFKPVTKTESFMNDEPMNLNFVKKEPGLDWEKELQTERKAPTIETDDLADGFLPDSLKELLKQAREDVSSTSKSLDMNSVTGMGIRPEETRDYLDIMSRVDHLLDDIQGEPGRADKREFLREAIDRDMMRDSTTEYRTTKQQALDELNASKKQLERARSQQLLDSILIQLREDDLNVNFHDVSDNVNIAEQPDGDGFTIETPHYKAKIHVEMNSK